MIDQECASAHQNFTHFFDAFLQDIDQAQNSKMIQEGNRNIGNGVIFEDLNLDKYDQNQQKTPKSLFLQSESEQYFEISPNLFQESKEQLCNHLKLHRQNQQQNVINNRGISKMLENISYEKQSRRDKINRYLNKKSKRIWSKKITYNCRKVVAETRIRLKGKFVKKTINFDIKQQTFQFFETYGSSKITSCLNELEIENFYL